MFFLVYIRQYPLIVKRNNKIPIVFSEEESIVEIILDMNRELVSGNHQRLLAISNNPKMMKEISCYCSYNDAIMVSTKILRNYKVFKIIAI